MAPEPVYRTTSRNYPTGKFDTLGAVDVVNGGADMTVTISCHATSPSTPNSAPGRGDISAGAMERATAIDIATLQLGDSHP